MIHFFKKAFFTLLFFIIVFAAKAQFGGLNGSIQIGVPCGSNCADIKVRVPNFKTTEDYVIKNMPFNPFPYIVAGAFEETALYQDDQYSNKYSIGFPFCFFGDQFPKMVVGSNGIVTFDTTNANCDNNYVIANNTNILPHTGGTQCQTSGGYIAKASILSPFHDIHPTTTPNPADRRIIWRLEGTAPHRRMVVTFYKLPHFTATTCIANLNTSQIVIHESTGLIEIHVKDKTNCSSPGTNGGRAIFGIQNFARDKAVTDPAKNPGIWTESNTSYRFWPNGPTALIQSVSIKKKNGTLVGNSMLSAPVGDSLDATYNYCLTGAGPDTLVVSANYRDACNPMVEFSLTDTVYVVKSPADLLATATTTDANCLASNGSVTVTVPMGAGSPPYQYSINGGMLQSSPTFNNLASGTYTIFVKDNSGSCTSTFTVNVGFSNPLMGTGTATAPTCAGATNGTATLTASNGTAPFQYSLGTSAYQTSNVFTGLGAGSYSFNIKDANGCVRAVFVIVPAGSGSLSATLSIVPTSCPGASNGVITINSPDGMAPHTYSINNGAFQMSNSFTNLAAGSYTVVFKDANGCTGTYVINVANGTGITATAAVTATTCTGVSNGAVTITANNGSTPYLYSLNNGTNQMSNTFTNLAVGMYTVKVTDNNGCFVNVAVNVTAGTGFSATSSTVATSCVGINNGSITVTPSGGNAPYTYVLDGGALQMTNIFNNVSAGAHSVLVTDNIGCTRMISVNVPSGTGFTATSSVTATSCTGANNGSITVTPSGGNTPYSYVLDGGMPQMSGTFYNVSAGTHTVVITDNVGCTNTVMVTVLNGNGFTATSTSIPTTCATANNGSITITVMNGATPYSYTINGGMPQSSNIFSGLAVGNYTINITDNNGCSGTVMAGVAAGAGVNATATTTNTSCSAVNDGTITVNATNGSGAFTYTLNGGAPQSSNQFTGLASGNYNITATDGLGCSKTIAVTVMANTGFNLSQTTTPAACAAATNGTATITVTGATGALQYAIDGGASQASNIFNNLTVGSHTVVVTNAAGCTNSITFTVAAGNGIMATITTTVTTCNGASDGTATITPANGTMPYQYQLGTGNFGAANIFNGLTTGSYIITVKDANNCITTTTAVITAGPNLNITTTLTPVLCNGGNTGSLAVTATNGNGSYMYAINGGAPQASPNFANLVAGSYNVTVTSANGCNGSAMATITEPTILVANATATAALCNGATDGIITATGTGGTTPYSYSINGGANYQPAGTFTVGAGNYVVEVRDAYGCIKTTNATVTQPTALTATTTVTPASCNGGADGSVTVNAMGGTAPFTYAINGGTFQATNVFNVVAGTYSVTVKDANNCTTNVTATVSLTSNIVLDARVDTTICEGQSVVLTTASNAVGFSWSPTVGLNNNTLQSPTASPIITTKYFVTGTLGGCSTTDSVTVTVRPAPIPNAGVDGEVCYGLTYQLQGSGGTQYSWTPAASLSNANIANPVANTTSTTKYSLHVIDANGCNSLIADTMTLVITPPLQAFAGLDTTVVLGQPYQMNSNLVPLPPMGTMLSYRWSPSVGLNNPNIQNPITILQAQQTYALEITTPAGCKGVDTVVIKVLAGPNIYVPTAFTPNGDGNNDVFKIATSGVANIEFLRLFNRWGQLVFETRLASKGWDGKLKGQNAPGGTYVYHVRGIDDKGKVIEKKGTLLLIR